MTPDEIELRSLVEEEAAGLSKGELQNAYAELSGRYRSGLGTPDMEARSVHAYMVARLPATFSSVEASLRALREQRPSWAPSSLLDLGSGTGAGSWAAVSVFPSIASITLVERESSMIKVGSRIASKASREALREAVWMQADATRPPKGTWDLVIASYLLTEVPQVSATAAVLEWWKSCSGELALVDAGTPFGFEGIRQARHELIQAGATITAPCPHDETCPMSGGNWCHFAIRLQRTSAHRKIKGAVVGFEDEKYSYVIASRQSPSQTLGRVLRHPQIRSGHVKLELCEPQGLGTEIVTRRDRDRYKLARRVKWGDSWMRDPNSESGGQNWTAP